MKWKIIVLSVCTIILFAGVTSAKEEVKSSPEKTVHVDPNAPGETAPIIVWDRTIAVLRAPYEDLTAAERAKRAVNQIKALPPHSNHEIIFKEVTVNGIKGIIIETKAKAHLLFSLLPGDIDPSSGNTLESTAEEAAKRLKAVLDTHAEHLKWIVLLKGIGFSAAATLLYLLVIWILSRIKQFTTERLDRLIVKRRHYLVIADINLLSTILRIERTITKLFLFAMFLTATYMWLTFCMAQFFFTAPWAQNLGAFFINLIKNMLLGIIGAVPGIVTVFIIFWITRFLVMGISGFFDKVERGNISSSWLTPDSARASRRIIIPIIWLFALSVAYPYIPGSGSAAFKGISVFAGVIISFGSANFFNQIMSGIVIAYSGAIHVGDYVRINNLEGIVRELGATTTKIATTKDEFVTIPNSLATGANIVNYSRLVENDGAVLSTTVTIGYDAPWRQIHALLLLAAKKAEGIRETPAPFVLQRALSDFYVEYELRFRIDKPEERYLVLSELHGEIQDAFNEAGVQIMSPHFERQPDGAVISPKSQWFNPPASLPDEKDT